MRMLSLPLILLLPLLVVGCLAPPRGVIAPGQLDVFDVTLHASTDYRELRGVVGIEEPCLKGYERHFDHLEIVIGYSHDGVIRKITTRNPQTAMFGIHPGETMASAREKTIGAGFLPTSVRNIYRRPPLLLTLLGDGSGTLFGLTLEESDAGR